MKKLKDDWQVATNGERVKFVIVILLEVIVGGYGIYLAALFSISAISKPADYTYLIPIALLMFILWLISKIPTKPMGSSRL